MVFVRFGCAKGRDDEGCLERGRRNEELSGNIVGGLFHQRDVRSTTGPMDGSTKSSLAFPFSLTDIGYDSSKPVTSSVRVRKHWCAFRGFLLLVVVRDIFRESAKPSVADIERGLSGRSLQI